MTSGPRWWCGESRHATTRATVGGQDGRSGRSATGTPGDLSTTTPSPRPRWNAHCPTGCPCSPATVAPEPRPAAAPSAARRESRAAGHGSGTRHTHAGHQHGPAHDRPRQRTPLLPTVSRSTTAPNRRQDTCLGVTDKRHPSAPACTPRREGQKVGEDGDDGLGVTALSGTTSNASSRLTSRTKFARRRSTSPTSGPSLFFLASTNIGS